MQIKEQPYKRIIFVCCNQRENNRECCNNSGGNIIRDSLKRIVKEQNLKDKIRICKSGCMGECDLGVNLMVFPDNIWIKDADESAIDEIAATYILPLR